MRTPYNTVALALLAAACSAPSASKPSSLWLDGREKSLLVVGYSTSYAWPAMLQQMLDEHSDGERVYHVLNAVVGGAPVEHWRAPEGSAFYERTVAAMLRDFFGDQPRLLGDSPPPSVAICQQSLQFTGAEVFGDFRGPVKSADDAAGIELGADAIEDMALRLHDLGLQDVIIAMHIYKHPIEPEVGNERIALARFLERGHDFAHGGPDVWSPTREAYPACFAEDGVHPDEQGMKLMAEGWYRSLAGADAREDVIERLFERAYDVEAMMLQYMAWRRESGPDPVPIYR